MNIKCTQNIYKSANGTSTITYYILVPEGVALCGVVQISHDVCDYFSRYTAFAKYLCSLGFVVCGNDHIGHGASAAKESDLGFFGAKNGWKHLVSDTLHLMHLMQKRYPDLPYFMYGQSMGSLVVRLCLTDPEVRISGAVLSATTFSGPYDVTIMHLADSIARAYGATYRSAFLNNFYFKGNKRKLKECQSYYDWMSRDSKVVSLYQGDEKCNFPLTSSGFRDLYILLAKANATATFRKTPHNVPMLFLSGDKDPVTHFGESVRRVVSTFRSIGTFPIDVIFYKDARHDILNEINRFDVFGDISRWLSNHLLVPESREVEDTEMLTDTESINVTQ